MYVYIVKTVLIYTHYMGYKQLWVANASGSTAPPLQGAVLE